MSEIFSDFSQEAFTGTVNEWVASVVWPDCGVSSLSVPSGLNFPSLTEMVDSEISSDNPRCLSEIEAERDSKLGDWESLKLKKNTLKSSNSLKKLHLPGISQIPPRAVRPGVTLVIQIYKTVHARQLKILEVQVSPRDTLLHFFTLVISQLPASRMFDGPAYTQSGLILVQQCMYIAGPVDYSEPICVWMNQNSVSGFSVAKMAETTFGQLSMSAVSTPCFVQCVGNEELRFYISNVALVAGQPASVPLEISYQRKVYKHTRCCLCTTRIADLVIVNDTILPKNPAYTCKQCYRRLRSARNGDFVPPPDSVIVSEHSQI